MRYIKFYIITVLLVCSFKVNAKVKLPVLISDGMVLQRDREIKIWGYADADEVVTVDFLNKKQTVVTGKNGCWELNIPAQKAGGPYSMNINGLEINDILIGDVWLCSGQSNMELPVSRVLDLYREEVNAYSNPAIRHLKVPLDYNFHEVQRDMNRSSWQELTPGNALSFSAVAYFFAKDLYEKTNIPVGLINASVGGSPAQAWISGESLQAFPVYLNDLRMCRSDQYVADVKQLDRERRDLWNEVLNVDDAGLTAGVRWSLPECDDADWQTADLLQNDWGGDGLSPVNGSHWFRRKFDVPERLAGRPAVLRLGCIVDADSVFVNGVFVGTTSYRYPPRIYSIPQDLLKPGENHIGIRLISYSGKPGFVKDKPYKIVFEDEEISLLGTWKYRLGTQMPVLPGETFFHYKPAGLYNAMIAPLENYALKGALWYQGESNTGNCKEYYDLMSALIADWRKLWKQPDLPFLIVQLANFMEPSELPAESNWAELRDVQLILSQEIPDAGLAVTIDIGEWNDIHPLNKKEVGKRLSLQARSIAYGDKKAVSRGPVFKSMRVDGNKIVLSFEEGTNDLRPVDELKGFAIAAADG